MASNMSIKIESAEGPVEGEYLESEGEIEVLQWSWGLSHDGSTHSGKGPGTGNLSVQDLQFTKPVDKATPALMRMCAKGIAFKEAVLTIRKASGEDESIPYLKITLLEGKVSGIAGGGAMGEEQITESVSLNFPRFKYEYTEQEALGAGGATVPMSWDIPTKKEF